MRIPRTASLPSLPALIIATLLLGAVLTACGSSSGTASPNGSDSTTTSVVSSSSLPPAPSTLPPQAKAPCTALASALLVNELIPKNSGNWTAERQRIATDVAGTVALYSAAANGVPAEVARALDTLKAYATWLGSTVSGSASYEAAKTSIESYAQSATIPQATATVENWRRANC